MRPRLRAGLVFLAAIVGLGLLTVAPAYAVKEFARIERIDVQPYFAHLARVRVWLNLVHLEGGLIDGVKPEELVLNAGITKLKEVPGVQRFERTGDELDIALMVNIGAGNPYTEEEFAAVVADFISKLPHSARVVIVPYGVHTTSIGPWEDPAKAARRWKKISPEDELDKPHLLDALDKTLKLFTKLEPLKPGNSTRKLIIVLGDGVDEETDVDKMRNHFRKVAKTASDAGITIDCVGFTLVDNRIPLQNLGELSKKTAGTFRWARERSGFHSALDAVGVEMRRELVLTYFVPTEQIAGKTLSVMCTSPLCDPDKKLLSTERKAPAPRCAGVACPAEGGTCVADQCVVLNLAATGGGFGGILIGGLAFLGVAGGAVVLLKRRKRGGGVVAGKGKGKGAKGQGQDSGPVGPAAVQVRRPTLTVLNGPLTGKIFPVTPGLMAGKNPASGIVINDGFSSGQHAQFIVDATGNCSIADMGSTNGTFVNGQRTAYAALTNGATVRIGQTDLRFSQG